MVGGTGVVVGVGMGVLVGGTWVVTLRMTGAGVTVGVNVLVSRGVLVGSGVAVTTIIKAVGDGVIVGGTAVDGRSVGAIVGSVL